VRGGGLAQVEDQSADAPADELGRGVHRPDAGRVDAGGQRGGHASGRVIAAVFGDPSAPAATAGKDAVGLDDDIGPVGDDLAVDPHQLAAGGDLVRRQKGGQRPGDRAVHERDQSRNVRLGGDAVGEVDHGSRSCKPFAQAYARSRAI
jgi:hypothetical protein